MFNLPETTRAYIYRVLVAVAAVLVMYGILGPEEVSAWLEVASALLLLGSSGLAAKNTPTHPNRTPAGK